MCPRPGGDSASPSLPRGQRTNVTRLSNLGGRFCLGARRWMWPPALSRCESTGDRFIEGNPAEPWAHESRSWLPSSKARRSHLWRREQRPCATSKTPFSMCALYSGIDLVQSIGLSTTSGAPPRRSQIALLPCTAGVLGRARVALLRCSPSFSRNHGRFPPGAGRAGRAARGGWALRRRFHNLVTTRESPLLDSAPRHQCRGIHREEP